MLVHSSLCFCQQEKLQLSSAMPFHVGVLCKDGRQFHLQDCMQAVHIAVCAKVQPLDLKASHRTPLHPGHNQGAVLRGRGSK